MDTARQYVEYLETLAHHWSSGRAATMLTPTLIEYLEPRLHRCSTPLKIRVVLSLLYLDENTRAKSRESLIRLLAEAEVDKDEWVRKLSRLISSFVTTGTIDIRDTDSETAFTILKRLGARKDQAEEATKPPLEVTDLVNIISEFMFTKHGQDILQDDTTEWWVEIPEDTFGTTEFRGSINFREFALDLTRKGDVMMRRALENHSQAKRF